MAIYSICYDLNKTGQNYTSLINEIKKSSDFRKPMESYWLVKTNESADQLYNRLAKFIDSNDRLIVTQVTRQYSGWLAKDVCDWLSIYSYELAS